MQGQRNIAISVRKEFFTVREAAEFLDVNERTIRRYVSAGRLVAVKYGTSRNSPVRITAASLSELVEEAKKNAEGIHTA